MGTGIGMGTGMVTGIGTGIGMGTGMGTGIGTHMYVGGLKFPFLKTPPSKSPTFLPGGGHADPPVRMMERSCRRFRLGWYFPLRPTIDRGDASKRRVSNFECQGQTVIVRLPIILS